MQSRPAVVTCTGSTKCNCRFGGCHPSIMRPGTKRARPGDDSTIKASTSRKGALEKLRLKLLQKLGRKSAEEPNENAPEPPPPASESEGSVEDRSLEDTNESSSGSSSDSDSDADVEKGPSLPIAPSTDSKPPSVIEAVAVPATTAAQSSSSSTTRGGPKIHGRGAGKGRGLDQFGEPLFEDKHPSWQAIQRQRRRE